ncbi:MAG: FAD-dependent monooxygenase [Hyphomicrobiaceae bacterium]
MPNVASHRPKTSGAIRAPDAAIAVVGTGPAGLLAALTLLRLGFDTTLVGPTPNLAATGANARTAALFPNSINLLSQLGIWDQCVGACEALRSIRIVDDLDNAILRAPEVLFDANEVGDENFGFNVPNDVLVRALWGALQNVQAARGSHHKFQFIETAAVTSLQLTDETATLICDDHENITAKLVVAADGRHSTCRQAAGLSTKTWSYPQTALTCVIGHNRPHAGVSTELHRQAGPCTTVPMTSDASGHRSSIVWIETPETAKHLQALNDEDFRTTIEQRLRGHLGNVTKVGPRAAFPLSGLTVPVAGGNRVALVGEAAHVMPPIGAQGLNLGFRDVMQLAELLTQTGKACHDPGESEILARYSKARKPDISARIWGVDLLNRSLLAGHGPAHLARGAGLAALKAFPALRRQAIRQGLNPFGPTPRLPFSQPNPQPLYPS